MTGKNPKEYPRVFFWMTGKNPKEYFSVFFRMRFGENAAEFLIPLPIVILNDEN